MQHIGEWKEHGLHFDVNFVGGGGHWPRVDQNAIFRDLQVQANVRV